MTLQITAQPTASSFVVGEAVAFRLTLKNTSSQPITVADPLMNEVDPVYTVTAPDGTAAPVRLLAARMSDPRLEPMAPPAIVTMPLPGNGTWSEELVLDQMLLLRAPGRYGLQATTSHSGAAVSSPQAAFDLEAAHVTAFAAAAAPPRTRDARLFSAWAHHGPRGAQIVEAVRLGDTWGDDQRGKLYSSTIHRGGAAVTGVAVAEALVERGMDFHGWVAWTEASSVWAIRTNAGKPEGAAEAVHQGAHPFSLARPLAMEGSYGARLYGVERASPGAEMVRIDVPRSPPGAAKVVSRTALPVVPAATVALHRDGSPSLVIFAGPEGDRTAVGAFEDGASPAAPVLARIGRLLPGRPLAARRAIDGRVLIACLTANQDNPHSARLWTAAFQGSPLASVSEAHHDLPDLDPAEVKWASVVVAAEGEHVLWRNTGGELRHSAPSRGSRLLDEPFGDTPVPELLSASGEAFLAGVRHDGSFSIESLSPRGHRH